MLSPIIIVVKETPSVKARMTGFNDSMKMVGKRIMDDNWPPK